MGQNLQKTRNKIQENKQNSKLSDKLRKAYLQKIIDEGYDQMSQRLVLRDKEINQVEDIFKFRKWENLKFIGLNNCGIEDTHIQFLCQFIWPQLKGLWLGKNQLTHKGLKLLLSNNLEKLKSLSIESNLIGDQGIKLFITEKESLLQSLNLADNNISSCGFKNTIIDWKFEKLTYLELSKNKIGSNGIKYLVKADLPMLQTLTLKQNEISIEGCIHLCKGKWPHILKFYLGITSSNIDVYRSFSLGNWKKLCIIDIENNPYSSKHFEQNRRQKYNGIGQMQCVVISSRNRTQIWSKMNNYRMKMNLDNIFSRRFVVN